MARRRVLFSAMLCVVVTIAIVFGFAGPASAADPRVYTVEVSVPGDPDLYSLCVAGISGSEKSLLTSYHPDIESEVLSFPGGKWTVCWDGLIIGELKVLVDATRTLTPAVADSDAPTAQVSLNEDYQPNGPHLYTSSGTATRSVSGTPWGVRRWVGGNGGTVIDTQQVCSSGATSCTLAPASAYFSAYETYSVATVVTQGTQMSPMTSGSFNAYCD